MKKRIDRKGFTLAEVLIVVAIIVVLAGVGVVALFSHMRNMQKVEMDGQAKELFIAAQNHLTLAKSQGYLGVAEFTGEGDSATSTGNFGYEDVDEDETKKGIYYIIVKNASSLDSKANVVLEQMLPFGSMDESARVSGSYIIRYQKDTAQVLDVFYVSTTDRRFGLSGGFTPDDYTNYLKPYIDNPDATTAVNLKEYGASKAVVGYYGGTMPTTLEKGQELTAPRVEIINAETLKVKVYDNNSDPSINGGENVVQLIVSGAGGAKKVFELYGLNNTVYEADPKDALKNDNRIGYDYLNAPTVFTVLLDSVTGTANDHFCALASDNGTDFKPGETLYVQARAFNNEKLTNVAESAVYTTNSLFASYDGTNTVEISNIRHLLNLDADYVSGLDITVTAATQTTDLDWAGTTGFLAKYNAADRKADDSLLVNGIGDYPKATGVTMKDPYGKTADNSFLPVWLPEGLAYNGGGHSISNVTITAAGGIPARNARGSTTETVTPTGLFGSLKIDSNGKGSVTDLELIDFNILTGSSAGALAGSIDGYSITGVLAHNSAIGAGNDSTYSIRASGNAGGLVGSMAGGKIDQSAAAVYVQASGNAGGLVGVVSGATQVYSSFSGGHTKEAKYLTENGDVVDGRLNVIGGTAAGGLIGDASGATNLDLQYSYSTCSASATVAGGLIGKGGSGTVAYCYATGLVYGGTTMDTFVGSDSSGLTFTTITSADPAGTVPTNYYLEGVSETGSAIAATALTGATAGDTSHTKFLLPSADQKAAVVYDDKVGGRYAFPTVDQLHTLNGDTAWTAPTGFAASFLTAHYGDWQMPTLEILHYTLINADTLYTDITLKPTTRFVTLALYGETSKAGTVYRLKINEGRNGADIVDRGTLKKETNGGTETVSIEWIGEESFAASVGSYKLPANTVSSEVLRVTLDDITAANKNFASVFPELIPGENVTLLVAGGKPTWMDLNSLRTKTYPEDMEDEGKIIALSDNSIFAKPENLASAAVDYEADSFKNLLKAMSNAEIINFRHLQNLDTDTSNVNAIASTMTDAEITAGTKLVTAAKLMNNLDCASSANFNGIYNKYLTSFTGNYKTIQKLVIGATSGEGAGYAGFFRKVDSEQTLTIKNLYLDSPRVTAATLDAGAFVALNEGALTLSNVLVKGDKDYKISGPRNVGGLVGSSKGSTLTIWNSASTMLLDGTAAAGGLLGKLEAGEATITNSYVGGHVTDRKYYVGTHSDANPWNIKSNGAAGGLIGETAASTTATISNTFNAASVYSTTSGKAGGLIGVAGGSLGGMANVYVVAPVNNVKTITEASGVYTPASGGSGSAMGQTSSDLSGVLAYYLLDAYSNPYPVQYTDDYSNIMPVGSCGTDDLEDVVGAIKPASYYQTESGGIIGMSDPDTLVVKTQPFGDSGIGERQYPFKIWTHFAFESTNASDDSISDTALVNYPLYYYGDWQPNNNINQVVVDLHFYRVLPQPDSTSKIEALSDDPLYHTRIQIPYRPAELVFSWPEEEMGYTMGANWDVYFGNIAPSNWAANGINDPDSDSFFNSYALGENVRLPVGDFQRLNQEKYYSWTEETDVPHIHLTCVCNYTKQEDALVKLSFYDVKTFTDDPKAKDYEDDPCATVMLSFPRTYLEDSTLTLDKVLAYEKNEGIEFPMRYVNGQRFEGWYSTKNEFNILEAGASPIFENKQESYVEGGITKYRWSLKPHGNTIRIERDGQEIKLYADYDKIETRKLTLKFVRKDNLTETILDDRPFEFEADRGFTEAVTLPTPGGLVPDSIVVSPTGSPSATLLTSPYAAQFQINPVANKDVRNGTYGDLTYTVKYKVGERAGYVIYFELMDTKLVNGEYRYDHDNVNTPPEKRSVVADYTDAELLTLSEHLYGITKPGEDPLVPVGASLLNCLNSEVGGSKRFEVLDEPIIVRLQQVTGGWTVPNTAEYADYQGLNFPSQVKVTEDGEEVTAAVQYLIVIQATRMDKELTFDSDEGSAVGTELVPYGKPLDFLDSLVLANADAGTGYKPERVNYEFIGWQTPDMAENEVIHGKYTPEGEADPIPSNIPEMPDKNMTVLAIWEGQPTGFTVAFWYENPKNTDDTDYSYVGKRVYTEAEGRKAGTKITSKDYKDAFDGVNSYGIDPATGEEVVIPLDSDHFAYYAGKQDSVKLRSDGTSVLNVYFNRNPVFIKFSGKYKIHHKNELIDGYDYFYVGPYNTYPLVQELDTTPYVMTEHTYTATTANSEPQFGLVNGEYKPLRREDASTYTWSPDWKYYGAADNATQNVFGLVGDTYKEYEPLTYVSGGFIRASGDAYQETDDSYSTTPDQYYLYQSYGYYNSTLEFRPLYYNNYTWYKTRTEYNGYYYYSDPIDNGYGYSYGDNRRYKKIAATDVGQAYDGQTYTISGQSYGRTDSGGYNSVRTYFPVEEAASSWVYNSWQEYTGTDEGYYYRYSNQDNGYVYQKMYRNGYGGWSTSQYGGPGSGYNGKLYLPAPYDGPRYQRSADPQTFGDNNETRYSQSGDVGSHVYTAVAADYHVGDQYYKDGNGGYVKLTGSNSENYNWYWSDGTAEHLYTGTRYTEGAGDRYTERHYVRSSGSEPYSYTPLNTADSANWTGSPDHYAQDGNIEDNEGAPAAPNERHGHVKLSYVQPSGEYIWVYYDEDGGRHIYEGNDFAYFDSTGSHTTEMTWKGKWESPFANNHYSWEMVDRYRWQDTTQVWNPDANWGWGAWETAHTTQTYMDAFINDEFDDGDDNFTYELEYVGPKGDYLIRHYKEGKDGLYHEDTEFVDYVNAYSAYSNGTFNFSNKFPYFTVSSYKIADHHSGMGGGYTTGPVFSSTGGDELPDNMKVTGYYPLYVYHSRNAYNITFINGTSVVKTVTGVKYEKPLGELGSLIPADPTTRPAGLDESYHFRGWCLDATREGKIVWFGTEKTGTFVENTMLTKDMPGGDLVLYAKWARDPVEVTFSTDKMEAKFLDADKTTDLNLTEAERPAIGWTNAAPKTDFTKKENGADERIPYGDLIPGVLDEDTGKLSDDYTATANGFKLLYWEYVGKDNKTHQLFVSSGVSEKMDLYPVFYKDVKTTDKVKIMYAFADDDGIVADNAWKQYGEEVEVRLGHKKIFSLDPKDLTEDTSDYVLETPYIVVEEVNKAWLDSNNREVRFKFVKNNSKWRYTVEYCVMLTPESGGPKEAVILLRETKRANSEYVFEPFYTLPENMRSGYTYVKKELRKYDNQETLTSHVVSHYTAAEEKDPSVFVTKGEADIIRIYLDLDVSGCLTDTVDAYYNGQSHDLTDAYIESKLPKVYNALAPTDAQIASEVEYDITQHYYIGNGSSEVSKDSIINAGIYRVEPEVTLIYTDTNGTKRYKYIIPAEYQNTSKPGIILTVYRRKVTITSKDVWNVFYDNDANNNDERITNNSAFKIADLATYDKNDIPTMEVQKYSAITETDDAYQDLVRKLKLNYQPSGEAFRRTPSADYTKDGTPNVFNASLQILDDTTGEYSTVDPNNFDVYKVSGTIYLWDSYKAYEDYKAYIDSLG